MARSRKSRVPRGTRRRRPRADWVYRNDVVGEDSALNSYGGWQPSNVVRSLGSGIDGAISTILYDSPNFLRVLNGADIVAGGVGADWILSQAARITERKHPTAIAVEGHVYWSPTTFTLGSRLIVKGRLGWYEQDDDTGQVLLETGFDIWDGPGDTLANNANNSIEHIHDFCWAQQGIVDNTIINGMRHFMWRGRRRQPSERHCLAIVWEQPNTSAYSNTGIRMFTQMRALMAGQD